MEYVTLRQSAAGPRVSLERSEWRIERRIKFPYLNTRLVWQLLFYSILFSNGSSVTNGWQWAKRKRWLELLGRARKALVPQQEAKSQQD